MNHIFACFMWAMLTLSVELGAQRCDDFTHVYDAYGKSVRRIQRGHVMIVKTDDGVVETMDGKRVIYALLKPANRLRLCHIETGQSAVTNFIRMFSGSIRSNGDVISTTGASRPCVDADRLVADVGGRLVDGSVDRLLLDVDLSLNFTQLLKRCRLLLNHVEPTRVAGNQHQRDSAAVAATGSAETEIHQQVEGTRPRASRRMRRSSTRLILPNTRWCGVGNMSTEENPYGNQVGVDLCCYEHDHCNYTIEAFSRNYNMFNFRFHTLSHCECDDRFRTCLRTLRSETADHVGNLFFNVIGMRCFVFQPEKVCVERTWYGKCIRERTVASAQLHDRQLSYESTYRQRR